MKLWGDMTRLERHKAVMHCVDVAGMTYAETAALLVATREAVAGVVWRSKQRVRLGRPPVPREPKGAPGRKKGSKQADKFSWTETRLTEPWAVWRERRRAERQREMTE